jgi:sulfopropanediol 3-dehydrogenase
VTLCQSSENPFSWHSQAVQLEVSKISVKYIKQAAPSADNVDTDIEATVKAMLANISDRGEQAVRDYAAQLDNWHDDFILGDVKRAKLMASVPEQTKLDIQFAHQQVTMFAQAQLASINEFEIESSPGVLLGQKIVPVKCAGCYVPGGR